METLFGGIETGGTKFICAVGTSDTDLRHITRITTTSFEETMKEVCQFFKEMQKRYRIPAIGIASFGPIDLNKESKTFGFITSTPKIAWQYRDLVGTLKKNTGTEVNLDIDVNGAALAEGKWGSATGLHSYLYITVGTGVGLGVVIQGQPLHGLTHPEGGHVFVPLHPKDPATGFCPFHRSCLEGLASAPAIQKRWNTEPATLADDHFAWELESYYLSCAMANYTLCLSPQRIIIGGGVLARRGLLQKIQKKTQEILSDYIKHEVITEHVDSYIVSPTLEYCGVLGAILLAQNT